LAGKSKFQGWSPAETASRAKLLESSAKFRKQEIDFSNDSAAFWKLFWGKVPGQITKLNIPFKPLFLLDFEKCFVSYFAPEEGVLI
jgi:hypothetical protein